MLEQQTYIDAKNTLKGKNRDIATYHFLFKVLFMLFAIVE